MADDADRDPSVGSHSELTFLIDRALRARQNRQLNVSIALARAAQGLMEAALPEIATSFSKAASRQGQGDVIAAGMIPHLTPREAAAVCVIWMLRGARSPAINMLKDAFGAQPEFDATIVTLCRRLFETSAATASIDVVSTPTMLFTPIETSAPYRR